jgi:hypothetical protein
MCRTEMPTVTYHVDHLTMCVCCRERGTMTPEKSCMLSDCLRMESSSFLCGPHTV